MKDYQDFLDKFSTVSAYYSYLFWKNGKLTIFLKHIPGKKLICNTNTNSAGVEINTSLDFTTIKNVITLNGELPLTVTSVGWFAVTYPF